MPLSPPLPPVKIFWWLWTPVPVLKKVDKFQSYGERDYYSKENRGSANWYPYFSTQGDQKRGQLAQIPLFLFVENSWNKLHMMEFSKNVLIEQIFFEAFCLFDYFVVILRNFVEFSKS